MMKSCSLGEPADLGISGLVLHRVLFVSWRFFGHHVEEMLFYSLAIFGLSASFMFAFLMGMLVCGMDSAHVLTTSLVGFLGLLTTSFVCSFSMGLARSVWKRYDFWVHKMLASRDRLISKPWEQEFPWHADRLKCLLRERALWFYARRWRRAHARRCPRV